LNIHGWRLSLEGVIHGVIRVNVRPLGHPQRTAAGDRIRAIVEQAIARAAPDADGVEVVGDVGGQPEGFVPLERLRSPGPHAGEVR
jgi:hypothetical protein